MSKKRPYYPTNIRRNDKYFFEVSEGVYYPFKPIKIYRLDGSLWKVDSITLSSFLKDTYLPQPDELARFFLVKEE